MVLVVLAVTLVVHHQEHGHPTVNMAVAVDPSMEVLIKSTLEEEIHLLMVVMVVLDL